MARLKLLGKKSAVRGTAGLPALGTRTVKTDDLQQSYGNKNGFGMFVSLTST